MNRFLPPLPLLLSRLGLAFCFLSFGIWEVVAPNLWTVYVPPYLSAVFDAQLLVFIHGVVLIIAALGVLSGYWPRIFTGLAVLVMLEICFEIITQEGFTETFIRDGGILLFTLGLFADALVRKKA